MDEGYLLAAMRYVEMNPVAAGLVDQPGGYRLSCARAHLERQDDQLVTVGPLLDIVGDWSRFLSPSTPDELYLLGLQNRCGEYPFPAEFDSHLPPPI